jgi:hypothetical protein
MGGPVMERHMALPDKGSLTTFDGAVPSQSSKRPSSQPESPELARQYIGMVSCFDRPQHHWKGSFSALMSIPGVAVPIGGVPVVRRRSARWLLICPEQRPSAAGLVRALIRVDPLFWVPQEDPTPCSFNFGATVRVDRNE